MTGQIYTNAMIARRIEGEVRWNIGPFEPRPNDVSRVRVAGGGRWPGIRLDDGQVRGGEI